MLMPLLRSHNQPFWHPSVLSWGVGMNPLWKRMRRIWCLLDQRGRGYDFKKKRGRNRATSVTVDFPNTPQYIHFQISVFSKHWCPRAKPHWFHPSCHLPQCFKDTNSKAIKKIEIQRCKKQTHCLWPRERPYCTAGWPRSNKMGQRKAFSP